MQETESLGVQEGSNREPLWETPDPIQSKFPSNLQLMELLVRDPPRDADKSFILIPESEVSSPEFQATSLTECPDWLLHANRQMNRQTDRLNTRREGKLELSVSWKSQSHCNNLLLLSLVRVYLLLLLFPSSRV